MYSFVYFCLMFMAAGGGKWSKVSDMVRYPHKATITNFDDFRQCVEKKFQDDYAGQQMSMESYKLVGFEAEFETVRDAVMAHEVQTELGHVCNLEGRTVTVNLRYDY